MKCNDCPIKHHDPNDGIECEIFPLGPLDDEERKDGEGCIYNMRTINKRRKELIEYWNKLANEMLDAERKRESSVIK